MNDRSRVILGDCLEILPTLECESVDSIVCDPPYEISFMSHKWDGTGIAYSVEMWRECLRVLKPGGHLVAFGGDRTYHRMACAIEDAGLTVRQMMVWVHGQGFPKSKNISMAIDQELGATRKVVGAGQSGKTRNVMNAALHPESFGGEYEITEAATPEAIEWDGWGSALKPAIEPICLARKPLRETNLARQVMATGTGAINIDACRVGTTGARNNGRTADSPIFGPLGPMPRLDYGKGRWPPNLLLSHSSDCEPRETRSVGSGSARTNAEIARVTPDGTFPGKRLNATESLASYGEETIVVWKCVAGCPVAELDRQSGETRSGETRSGETPGSGGIWSPSSGTPCGPQHGDSGGASRFYPQFPFRYQAKPSRAEKDAGLDEFKAVTGGEATKRSEGSAGLDNPRAGAGRTGGARNTHSTVKPVALMRWLVKLVTPPGGLVLDPFAGSGTTGVACVREQMRFIGIDMVAKHVEIAEARIKDAAGPDIEDLPLFAELAPPTQISIFDAIQEAT